MILADFECKIENKDIAGLYGARELNTIKNDEISVFLFLLKQTLVKRRFDSDSKEKIGKLIRVIWCFGRFESRVLKLPIFTKQELQREHSFSVS